jgi:hypothetical protein
MLQRHRHHLNPYHLLLYHHRHRLQQLDNLLLMVQQENEKIKLQ